MEEGIMEEIRKTISGFYEQKKQAFAPLIVQRNVFNLLIQNTLEQIKLSLPNMDGIYKRMEYSIQSNTKYGWCLSSGMEVPTYNSISDQEDNQEIRDRLFVEYFERDDMFHYKDEKKEIFEKIDPPWKELMDNAFYLIENGRFSAAIPIFMIVLEHEIAILMPTSTNVGLGLLRTIKDSFKEDQQMRKFTLLVGQSIISTLQNNIFDYRPFDQERGKIINRNWVLHGRDNPNYWTKADAFRLMTIISALCFIKD